MTVVAPAGDAGADRREDDEDPAFLARQLITCIGNKRALLPDIDTAIGIVRRRLGGRRLRLLDAFAGSGVVSRLFKAHATYLASNDLEDYAVAAARCYLANCEEVPWPAVAEAIDELNAAADRPDSPGGFIEALYAPRDDERIRRGERVFYTRSNARRLDVYGRLVAELPSPIRAACLGPLLSEASIHANTAGVFKGFYKDRATGIGRFGGSGADALSRIRGEIRLTPPVLSRFSCEVHVSQGDANALVRQAGSFDLAYFDPPYNQHPYGSNYFMLNLLVRYEPPRRVSRVSGIPADWRRSSYNVRAKAEATLEDLLAHTDAPFVLLSFNDEGFLARPSLDRMLGRLGRVEVVERRYHAFRGSRNLRSRASHVTERLFLVERR